MNDGTERLTSLQNQTMAKVYPDDLPEWRLRWRLRQIDRAFLIEGIVRRNRAELIRLQTDYQKRLGDL